MIQLEPRGKFLGRKISKRGSVNARHPRRACREFLRSLDIQPPLDMFELCAEVSHLRGRPIELVEYPLSDGEFALSWSAEDFDVIVWRKHTSPWHRDHSIAHEIGHLLCGHIDPEGEPVRSGANYPHAIDDALSTLRGGHRLPPGGGRMRRACYDSPHETTVELIATTLLQWSCVPGRAPSVLPQGIGLSRALAWRRGWL